uniref:Uncharacterized protein n=1 Tax=Acanthochromis polyacanthus TaxID=80966 RepID=A0A3Q1EA54_9TELE
MPYFPQCEQVKTKGGLVCSTVYLCFFTPASTGTSHLRSFSSSSVFLAPLSSQAEGSGVFQQGPEYHPKNIKHKRTHGWIKKISSHGGIEVLRNHSHIKGSFWKPVRLSRNRCWF